MSAVFLHGLEIGMVIGALLVALPMSRALSVSERRAELTWKRAKWRKP